MELLVAPLEAVVGGPARVVSSLAFSMAHRAAKRDPNAVALIVRKRRGAPPLAVLGEDEPLRGSLGGHGDDDALDRLQLKYVDTCADVAWVLNSLQNWPATFGPRPTLLVLDDVAELVATGAPTLEDDAALGRLILLAKLAASAAEWLQCGCVLACADASPVVRTILRRHFPSVRVVESRSGQLVVCDHADAVARVSVRDCGTHLRATRHAPPEAAPCVS